MLSPCCEAPVAWYTASVKQDMVKIICGECGTYVKFASKSEKNLIRAGVWKHP